MLRRAGRPARSLATVVFTDIAGSTELAASVGDQRWRRILERHNTLVRADLRRFGGHEVDTAGDGFFATFGSPGPAVEFALALAAEAPDVGVQIRAGIHAGEVELIGGKAGGLAVHVGARIAAQAAPGMVLVSATVKDLVAGSDVHFDDLGERELKGAGRWHLYVAHAPEPSAPADDRTGDADRRADARIRRSRTEAARAAGWRRFITSRAGRALVLVLALALVGSASLLYATGGPRLLDGVPPDSIGRIDAGAGGIVAALPVGALPSGIAYGEGSLWVTDLTDGTLARVDPSTARIIQTIQVGNSPGSVADGAGAIWVTDEADRTISRIDPGTNRQVATITVGNGPSGIAADDHSVWVSNLLDGTLSRVDATSGTVTTTSIGITPDGVAVGAGSVWVTDLDGGDVLRVDPSTGEIAGRVPVGNGPSAVAATSDAVWVVNSRDGTVSHIDPVAGRVVATIPVGDGPTAIAIASGAVWVAVSSTSEIVRIDPAAAQITRRVAVVSSPRSIAMAGQDPWFTAQAAATTSHRGGTLKLIQLAGTTPPVIDPVHIFDSVTDSFATPGLLSITNDGLVAYRRTGGSDGLTLTPDLADAIPSPTDGGRTYAFQLRSRITYSDGQPLRASDVRHSFERAIATDAMAAQTYGTIVGASACASNPPSCDLSQGIVADDQTGSVTFHLTTPSPGFIGSLTQPEGDILPSSVPFDAATSPLPATGPYVIAAASIQAIRLIRNPHFVQWSADAQPDGYPDEIDVAAVPSGTDEVGMVERGDADLSLDTLPSDRVAELQTRFASQLHVTPTFLTYFEFMDTDLAPFNDPKVRQAVNLATDRQKVIEAWGGPLSGRVTCQTIPPGFPGYVPYCPYTVDPNPTTGAWTAPDLSTARSLVAQSGTAGTHVEVVAADAPGFRDVARYFVSVLDQLGFVASLRVMSWDDFFGAVSSTATSTFQMTGYWFAQTDPDPAGIFAGGLTCPGSPVATAYPDDNSSHFCDPAIDQRIGDAVRATATDPASANGIWTEVDHRITDEAPYVAAFNPTTIDLVSRRLGGYEVNPLLGLVLLDQLWVR